MVAVVGEGDLPLSEPVVGSFTPATNDDPSAGKGKSPGPSAFVGEVGGVFGLARCPARTQNENVRRKVSRGRSDSADRQSIDTLMSCAIRIAGPHFRVSRTADGAAL